MLEVLKESHSFLDSRYTTTDQYYLCLNLSYILTDYTTAVETFPTTRFKYLFPLITQMNVSF